MNQGIFLLDAASVDALGYLAAGFVFLAFCMKTMLSLRLVAIASNVAFILYALLGGLMPILLLHGTLLPLNLMRLIQLQRRVLFAGKAAKAQPPEDQLDHLIAAGSRCILPAGATLFGKGDPADSLFVVIEGKVFLPEIGVTLGPGAILGEIGLFSEEGRRTASAKAVGPLTLSRLTEPTVRDLYRGNPGFAERIARLIAQRLVNHLRMLETRTEVCAAAIVDPGPCGEVRH